MKTFHLVVDGSRVVDYLTTPIRINRRRLRDRGIDVSFHADLTERSLACDTLVLVSKPVFRLLQDRQFVLDASSPTVRLLQRARAVASKIVWLDSADSTGATHFELLPYVDLYLKGQLLKDRTLYDGSFYGGRMFSDYYHRHFGLVDENAYGPQHPLEEKFSNKVALGWNIGLAEVVSSFSGWAKVRARLRRALPNMIQPSLNWTPVSPLKARPIDIFLRCSTNWPRQSVVFHRQELIRRLEEVLADHPDISGSVRGHLSSRDYLRTMGASKLAFGPFGWGELNAREYEALMLGCLLLRPDLAHMETWPDIFRGGETCMFYRWDFEDLETQIQTCLDDAGLREGIAVAGQEAFLKSVSDEGMEHFSDWFVQQLAK